MIEFSSSNLNEFLELRKSLHRHPELGYAEIVTTENIKNFLARHGVPFTPFEDMTGGYALIDAGKESSFGFRCDIDALPLSEQTGVEFASQTHGVMHACGHDMHMTIGAALSVQLFRHKDRLSRNVVVLFQPAEECNPRGGAAPVIETGFLQKLNIAEMYGLHVWPSLPVGTVALRPGPLMGASDHFRIEVHGRKSHAAEPHNGVDAILIAAQIYTALVHKLRRELPPFAGSLVSIGTFRSEGRYNVICGHVTLEGTLRSIAAASREHARKRIPELASAIAQMERGSAEVFLDSGYGIVENNKRLYEQFSAYAASLLGNGHVVTDVTPTMIGEDFSAFCASVPSLYFFLGCECPCPLHSGRFLPREECLATAVNLMTNYFLSF